MKTNALDPKVRDLLGQAAEWRLLAMLFECPGAGWKTKVAALCSETNDSALQAAAERLWDEASEGLYHSIFGPGGPAPPREASYHDSIQLGYLLSELAAFYDAFAYRPATSEVPDHVSVETGFVAYLRLKEAYALACSDKERAEVTAKAAERFIADHLSAIAEPISTALSNSGVAYLALAGEALLRRVGPAPKGAVPPGRGHDSCVFECAN